MGTVVARPTVLDATVLSNFASSGGVDWLVETVERPGVVPAVEGELERGLDFGHQFLAAAIEPVGEEILRLEPSSGAASNIPESSEKLDTGEAQSLRCAVEYDGVLATDDLAARKLANRNDVPVTGSIGLLMNGIERDEVTPQTANEWLATWRTVRSYYAPRAQLLRPGRTR